MKNKSWFSFMQMLEKRLAAAGIPFEKNQITNFQKYYDLLLDWSQRTNLISTADQSRIVERHFLESVAVLPAIEINQGVKILDVGSGAGFPSIPICLLRPDINFFLVESKRMKVLFLRQVVEQLSLKNVSVFGERCESFADKEEYQRSFDFVFNRAVGKLEMVYAWVLPVMKPQSSFIAWKGGDVTSEINGFKVKYKNKKIELLTMDERLVEKEKNRSLVIVQ
ncbi:16S rRNA (guanine(527)-N(7))-methyltransferase RsmG [candidate division KSB1 bacterium]|nr:16S rRNA (guanine(527)-N(7))-methyltransferase RsmG [candidate division KSB1 bacterium]